jgi:hypothetical protein
MVYGAIRQFYWSVSAQDGKGRQAGTQHGVQATGHQIALNGL